MNINNFYDAWNYLCQHPMFQNNFNQCLDIEVVKINPKTKEIDLNNKELNTQVEIWLETGPYIKDGLSHDIDLDCGGSTFEEAILNLAKLVKEIYTDDINIIKRLCFKSMLKFDINS